MNRRPSSPSGPVAALAVLAVLVAACGGAAGPVVDLRGAGVSAAPDVPASPPASPTAGPIRLAAAPVLSPRGNMSTYAPFVRHLEVELGRPVELVQRKTYAEINDLVRSGGVDIALVCGGAYVKGHTDFGMELLAAPVRDGRPEYFSYLVVPRASTAASLLDLRGKRFAFTDPMSNSGRFVPLFELANAGETPDSFFAGELFTYSHDNSVRAVADHMVDGAAVDSWVYEALIEREPALASSTRVIARSGPYSSPPVVVSPALDPETKSRARQTLLHMHDDSRGRDLLAAMGIDRFVEVQDTDYESKRRMSDALAGRPRA